VCTAATGFAGVAALAIAELSTTGALAARVIRLLCRGLLSCGPTVLMRDRDAWVQQRCSAGRVLCAQLPTLKSALAHGGLQGISFPSSRGRMCGRGRDV